MRIAVALMMAAALAGCAKKKNEQASLDTLDNQLTNGAAEPNTRDPVASAALRDQIMVDPGLAQQSNHGAVRPAPQPYSGEVPPDAVHAPPGETGGGAVHEVGAPTTAVALVAHQKYKRLNACAKAIGYSGRWAAKLPAELPLYPGARVTEAAGNDTGGCALRVVSFQSASKVDDVLSFYAAKAKAAGYSASPSTDGGERQLAGMRGADGGVYQLYARPGANGGSEVDLVVNRG